MEQLSFPEIKTGNNIQTIGNLQDNEVLPSGMIYKKRKKF